MKFVVDASVAVNYRLTEVRYPKQYGMSGNPRKSSFLADENLETSPIAAVLFAEGDRDNSLE